MALVIRTLDELKTHLNRELRKATLAKDNNRAKGKAADIRRAHDSGMRFAFEESLRAVRALLAVQAGDLPGRIQTPLDRVNIHARETMERLCKELEFLTDEEAKANAPARLETIAALLMEGGWMVRDRQSGVWFIPGPTSRAPTEFTSTHENGTGVGFTPVRSVFPPLESKPLVEMDMQNFPELRSPPSCQSMDPPVAAGVVCKCPADFCPAHGWKHLSRDRQGKSTPVKPTKTFIIAGEEYTRFGDGEYILKSIQAESLDECIRKLEPELCPPAEECNDKTGWKSPTHWLRESNGDGMNGYAIKELRPDGSLSENLLLEGSTLTDDNATRIGTLPPPIPPIPMSPGAPEYFHGG